MGDKFEFCVNNCIKICVNSCSWYLFWVTIFWFMKVFMSKNEIVSVDYLSEILIWTSNL